MINDESKLNRTCVESIYERFIGKKFEQKRYLHIVYHAIIYDEAKIMTTKISYDNME